MERESTIRNRRPYSLIPLTVFDNNQVESIKLRPNKYYTRPIVKKSKKLYPDIPLSYALFSLISIILYIYILLTFFDDNIENKVSFGFKLLPVLAYFGLKVYVCVACLLYSLRNDQHNKSFAFFIMTTILKFGQIAAFGVLLAVFLFLIATKAELIMLYVLCPFPVIMGMDVALLSWTITPIFSVDPYTVTQININYQMQRLHGAPRVKKDMTTFLFVTPISIGLTYTFYYFTSTQNLMSYQLLAVFANACIVFKLAGCFLIFLYVTRLMKGLEKYYKFIEGFLLIIICMHLTMVIYILSICATMNKMDAFLTLILAFGWVGDLGMTCWGMTPIADQMKRHFDCAKDVNVDTNEKFIVYQKV